MQELVIYLRLEPSLVSEVVQYVPESQRGLKQWWDVVAYKDRRCRQRDFVAYWPCTYTESKPKKRHKYTNLNCVRRRIIWLPDKEVKKLPTIHNFATMRDARNGVRT